MYPHIRGREHTGSSAQTKYDVIISVHVLVSASKWTAVCMLDIMTVY